MKIKDTASVSLSLKNGNIRASCLTRLHIGDTLYTDLKLSLILIFHGVSKTFALVMLTSVLSRYVIGFGNSFQ